MVERLRKDGMPEADAEKLVRKADDALQNDIHATGRYRRHVAGVLADRARALAGERARA